MNPETAAGSKGPHFLQDSCKWCRSPSGLGPGRTRVGARTVAHIAHITLALPRWKQGAAQLCWHPPQRSSPGAEIQMCVLAWGTSVKAADAFRDCPGWPGSEEGQQTWARHETACSVGKSSCRPLRNDSSLLPRWGGCPPLPGLSKERKRGWHM